MLYSLVLPDSCYIILKEKFDPINNSWIPFVHSRYVQVK